MPNLAARVAHDFGKVSEATRQLIVLAEVWGFDVIHIADIQGLSIRAVRSQIRRGYASMHPRTREMFAAWNAHPSRLLWWQVLGCEPPTTHGHKQGTGWNWSPPRNAEYALRFVPGKHREAEGGDLHEEFLLIARDPRQGIQRANVWYWFQVVRICGRALLGGLRLAALVKLIGISGDVIRRFIR
jgi:hypothetical protein